MEDEQDTSFAYEIFDYLYEVFSLELVSLIEADASNPLSYRGIDRNDYLTIIRFFYPKEHMPDKAFFDKAMDYKDVVRKLDDFCKEVKYRSWLWWTVYKEHLQKKIGCSNKAQEYGYVKEQNVKEVSESKYERDARRVKDLNKKLPPINKKSRERGFNLPEIKALPISSMERSGDDELDLVFVLCLIAIAHSEAFNRASVRRREEYLQELSIIIARLFPEGSSERNQEKEEAKSAVLAADVMAVGKIFLAPSLPDEFKRTYVKVDDELTEREKIRIAEYNSDSENQEQTAARIKEQNDKENTV